MRTKLITGALLFVVALAFALTCDPERDETAPSASPAMDPNATSPDEQGESGSLIER